VRRVSRLTAEAARDRAKYVAHVKRETGIRIRRHRPSHGLLHKVRRFRILRRHINPLYQPYLYMPVTPQQLMRARRGAR
jgi:hypothetical protein